MCSYIMMIFTFYCFFFFFSSRRRHTRCSRDWSSDVCSSDLALMRIRRNQVRAAEPLDEEAAGGHGPVSGVPARIDLERAFEQLSETSRADRKSTRLNSSHGYISYAVFCLKKKKDKYNKKSDKNADHGIRP